MRIHVLTLAIVLAAGCAQRTAEDTPAAAAREAATPAPATPAPSPPPIAPTPPPATGATVPSRFQGRYATDAAACADPAHESRLTIEASRIAFHESSGAITGVAQGPDEVGITARLSGEGETREASYRFRLSHDGDTLTDVGNALARRRCG